MGRLTRFGLDAPRTSVRRPRAGAGELGLLALAVFACFVAGAASGPHPYDVGELVGAAAQLGGSHPPGQPLHALLGHGLSFLPLGSLPLRVSLLSALAAALAAYAAGRAVLAWTGAIDGVARGTAAVVLVAVACLPAVLRNAMRPEVYTAALALVMLSAWALALRTRRVGPSRGAGLRVAALLAGLAFTLHPPHALAIAAMGLASMVAARPARREVAVAVAFGLLGLLPLAYLPVRAAAGASMWGDASSVGGLLAYVSGVAYHRNLGAGEGGRAEQLTAALRYVVLEGGGAAVLLAPFALGLRATRVAWAMALVATLAALLQPIEERNPDNVAYFAPALAAALVAGGVTLVELARARPPLGYLAPLLALAPVAYGVAGSHVGSAELPALETFAFELVDAPAPRALLVVRTDFVAGAAMMSRDVDALRPDLALFVEGLATSSWHWRSLRGHAPFDGRAVRTATLDPRVAFVEGALLLARDRVEIDVESPSLLAGAGLVRGGLLVAPALAAPAGVDERSMAERTFASVVSTLRWASEGDHEAGAQVLRNAIRTRAELLYARSEGRRARRELVTATGLPLDALAALDPGPLARRPARLVRDPRFFLASREDLVRQASTLLAAGGRLSEASALLEAQSARGELRALLQLAVIQQSLGLDSEARTSLAAYRAAADDPDAEIDRLETARPPR